MYPARELPYTGAGLTGYGLEGYGLDGGIAASGYGGISASGYGGISASGLGGLILGGKKHHKHPKIPKGGMHHPIHHPMHHPHHPMHHPHPSMYHPHHSMHPMHPMHHSMHPMHPMHPNNGGYMEGGKFNWGSIRDAFRPIQKAFSAVAPALQAMNPEYAHAIGQAQNINSALGGAMPHQMNMIMKASKAKARREKMGVEKIENPATLRMVYVDSKIGKRIVAQHKKLMSQQK